MLLHLLVLLNEFKELTLLSGVLTRLVHDRLRHFRVGHFHLGLLAPFGPEEAPAIFLDTLMMTFGGKERTKAQWTRLAQASGFAVKAFNKTGHPTANFTILTKVGQMGRAAPLPPATAFTAGGAAAAEEPLVDYVVENAAAIPAPLAGWTGPAEAGAAVFGDAGCAECHAAPGFEDAPAIGPDLTGVGARLTEGEIRLMIVNPSIILPETDMPAYYEVGVLGEAPDELVGRTRLTPTEIEQAVAWLASLKD